MDFLMPGGAPTQIFGAFLPNALALLGIVHEEIKKADQVSYSSFIFQYLSKWNAAISPLCLSKPLYGGPSIT